VKPNCLALLLIASCSVPEFEDADRAKPDQPDAAEAWRLMTLRDELGNIPHNALIDAKTKALAVPSAGAAGGLDQSKWNAIGPGNIGGRMRAIAIHPTTPSTIFVGSVAGGIWKTTNGGATWSACDDLMADLAITSIVFTPGDPSILYAATGEAFSNADSIRGAGIFKSTDGGAKWAQLASTSTSDFYWVARLSFSADGVALLAATRTAGLWRSTNGGATFTRVYGSTNTRCQDVKFHPRFGNVAIAHLGDAGTSTVIYSTDTGQTWLPATGIATTTSSGVRIELAWHKGYTGAGNGCAYAMKDSSSTLYRSIDGGASWTQVSTSSILGSQGWYDNALWVDPSDADADTADDVVIAGRHRPAPQHERRRDVHEDLDLVELAQQRARRPAHDRRAPGLRRLGQQDGLLRQRRRHLARQRRQHGLEHVGLGQPELGPADHAVLRRIALPDLRRRDRRHPGQRHAALHRQRQRVVDDVRRRRRVLRVQPGQRELPTTASTSTRRCTARRTAARAPRTSTRASPRPAPRRRRCSSPLSCSTRTQQTTLYVGCDSLWRSTNATSSPVAWAAVKPPIASAASISAIAVAPGNPNLIWVGHTDGDVWYTTNGTAATPTWTRRDNTSPALPNRYVTRITIDPKNTSRVFVTFGSYAADNIWQTTSSGPRGWLRPGCRARRCATSRCTRRIPGWLYAATELGLYVSESNGSSWSRGATPANVSIDELFWSSHHLYLVTHGRGMFEQSPYPAPSTTSVGAACTFAGPVLGPALTSGVPRLGAAFAWTLGSGPAGGNAVLYVSAVPPAPTLLSPGCYVQVDPLAAVSLGTTALTAAGAGSFPFALPDDPALAGIVVMTQAAAVDAGSTQLVFSNGVRLALGY
jgi:hypothetical protein